MSLFVYLSAFQDGFSLANFEAFPLIQYDITSSSSSFYGVKEGERQQGEEIPLLSGAWGLGRVAPMNAGLHATTVLTRDDSFFFFFPETPEREKKAKHPVPESSDSSSAAEEEEGEGEEQKEEDKKRERGQMPLAVIQDCVVKRLRDGSLSSKKSLVVLRIKEMSVSLLDFLLSKSLNLLLLLPPPSSPSSTSLGRRGDEEEEKRARDDQDTKVRKAKQEEEEEEEKMLEKKIHEIEQYLLQRYLPGLCLFAVETRELGQVYRHLQQRQREKMLINHEGQQLSCQKSSSPFHLSNLLEKTFLSSLSLQRIPLPSSHPFAASYLLQPKRLTPLQTHGRNLFVSVVEAQNQEKQKQTSKDRERKRKRETDKGEKREREEEMDALLQDQR